MIFKDKSFVQSCILINENSFDVDDTIAKVIIILNQKGYQTENCCASHYYHDDPSILLPEKYTDQNLYYELDKIIHLLAFDEDGNVYPTAEVQLENDSCYISFAPWVTLPSIPSGFNLLEWAITLPNFNIGSAILKKTLAPKKHIIL